MEEGGWCVHEISRYFRQYSLTPIWSIACMQRRDTDRLNHSHCRDADTCIAQNIDARKYEAEHTTTNCSREAVGTTIGEVNTVLEKEGFQ
jgi:hypothetical protein